LTIRDEPSGESRWPKPGGPATNKKRGPRARVLVCESGRRDLNPRPPEPHSLLKKEQIRQPVVLKRCFGCPLSYLRWGNTTTCSTFLPQLFTPPSLQAHGVPPLRRSCACCWSNESPERRVTFGAETQPPGAGPSGASITSRAAPRPQAPSRRRDGTALALPSTHRASSRRWMVSPLPAGGS
jgi:hypothetical protein